MTRPIYSVILQSVPTNFSTGVQAYATLYMADMLGIIQPNYQQKLNLFANLSVI